MIKKLFTKLLPPTERVFFDYFERQAALCGQVTDILSETIRNGLKEEATKSARELKHDSNRLTEETLRKLNATLITPIDREDIQHVNLLLNKIVRKVVKVILILKTYQLTEYPDTLMQQVSIMSRAADELSTVIQKFKNFKNVKEIVKCNERMDAIETQGDEQLYHAMLDLFSDKYDALTVIKQRDIYNNIESALDLCFNVSDTVVNIVLKHT